MDFCGAPVFELEPCACDSFPGILAFAGGVATMPPFAMPRLVNLGLEAQTDVEVEEEVQLIDPSKTKPTTTPKPGGRRRAYLSNNNERNQIKAVVKDLSNQSAQWRNNALSDEQ